MTEFVQNCAKARLIFSRFSEELIELIDPQMAVGSASHIPLSNPRILPVACFSTP